jgi:hypothetical protein
MTRPVEYDNLIRNGALLDQPATPGALAAYLNNAAGYLAAARALDPAVMAMPVFSSAYEGLFQLVQAVFEFREVRIKDAGRNLAFQLAGRDLGMSNAQWLLVVRAHERRNATAYRSPFPPVSKAEAQGLVDILAQCIPLARRLTGQPQA